MKQITVMAAVAVMLVASQLASAATPILYWGDFRGGNGTDIAYNAALDDDGNVFVTGTFTNTANFGGANLISAGGNDVFLAKFSPTGAHIWSKRFGSTSNDQGRAVAVDHNGNVYVTAYFAVAINMGGVTLISAGSSDIVLAKYTSDGIHLWSRTFGGTGADQPTGLVADGGANVVLTGLFNGSVDFGGGTLVSAGSGDVVLAKYDTNGNHTWSHRFGSTGNDIGYDVAVDHLSRIVITGNFSNTVDFGGGGITSAGSNDVFVAKYGISGLHMWSAAYGGSQADFAGKVAAGRDGTIAITGSFRGSAVFGGDTLTSAGANDIYLASFDRDGVPLWSRSFGSATSDDGEGLAVDELGNVYLASNFDDTVDFGGGPLGEDGGADLMVGKYSNTGEHRWAHSYDASNHVYPRALRLTPNGEPITVGYGSGTIDFGGGVQTATANDIFLVKLGPPAEPVITSISDIGNDQGGKVKIRFDRSGHDASDVFPRVLTYDVYRRDGGSRSASATWTHIGSAPAHGESGYGLDVPTLGDSTVAGGQFWSAYYVRATTSLVGGFYESAADSGYSLDNLQPGVPGGASLLAGMLSWSAPTDPDVSYFTVYGGNQADFGLANVIDATTETSLDVSASPYPFYFVTAIDIAGNESAPAQLASPTSAGNTPTRFILSLTNYPNPFNPTTSIRYTVPAEGVVTISVYDARGTHVTTLVNAERHGAGAYRVSWGGRNSSARSVSTGVYFARIEHNGITQTRKMLLIK